MKWISMSFAAVCLSLSGCVEIVKTPAGQSVNWQENAPIPQKLYDQIEADVRALVRKIHLSGSETPLEQGDQLDQFQLWAQPVVVGQSVRDRYTGEYSRCSDVLVTTKLNYQKITYRKIAPQYARNHSEHKRVDRICTYESTGREHYTARVSSVRS